MTGFTLYVVGEGIEKKVDDFAAEVAAQVAAAKGAVRPGPGAGGARAARALHLHRIADRSPLACRRTSASC